MRETNKQTSKHKRRGTEIQSCTVVSFFRVDFINFGLRGKVPVPVTAFARKLDPMLHRFESCRHLTSLYLLRVQVRRGVAGVSTTSGRRFLAVRLGVTSRSCPASYTSAFLYGRAPL